LWDKPRFEDDGNEREWQNYPSERESRLGRAGLALREFPLNKVFRILA